MGTPALIGSWRSTSDSVGTSTATRYITLSQASVVGTTTEANAQTPINFDGTVTHLGIYVQANDRVNTTTFRSRKNGGFGSLNVAIPAGLTGYFEDAVNADVVAPGDLYCAVVTLGTNSANFAWQGAQAQIEADTGLKTIYGARDGSTTISANSTTNYQALLGNRTGVTEARSVHVVRAPGTLSDLSIYVSANARITDTVLRLRKNGGNGNMVVTVPAGMTGVFTDSSNTDTIADGDEICVSLATSTGGGNLVYQSFSATFEASDGKFDLGGVSEGTRGTPNFTAYAPPFGAVVFGTTTEADAQLKLPFDAVLTNMRSRVLTLTGSGNLTMRSRINGANGNQSYTHTSANSQEDTVQSDIVEAGDLIGVSMTHTSPGAANSQLSYVAMTIEPQPVTPPTPTLPDSKITVATFQLSNGVTGNVDLTTQLDGKTPKAALFFFSDDNIANATGTVDARMCVGMTDGSRHFFASTYSQDGAGATNVVRRAGNNRVFAILNSTGTIVWSATFGSFIEDGVRINIGTAAAFDTRVTVIFFYGDDMDAYVDQVDLQNSATTVDITAPGFTPDAIILTSCANPGADTSESFGNIGIGIATADETQYSLIHSEADALGAGGAPTGIMSSQAVLAQVNAGTTTVAYTVTADDFDASGFSLIMNAAAGNDVAGYLAFNTNGRQVKLQGLTAPTSDGDQAITTVGFPVDTIITVGSNFEAYNTPLGSDALAGGFAVGGADRTRQAVHAMRVSDGSDPSSTAHWNTTSYAMMTPDDGTGLTSTARASRASMNDDGFTLTWSGAQATAKLGFVLAIEGEPLSPPVPPPTPPSNSRGIVTVIIN